jgi:3-hydroxy-D-aspartate aldolase
MFDDYEHALFVYATVMSVPTAQRAVLDAGLKAFAVDSGMPVPWHLPGAVYHRPSDEHGILDLSACARRLERGDRVLLVPGHCDPTVNLHDWYVGVRGLGTAAARVGSLWPVAARGAVF